MDEYLQRYNSLTSAAQAASDPAVAPQMQPQQVPSRMNTATMPAATPNFLPQAPSNSPMLPPSVVNPAGVQAQQQSLGEEFMVPLQQLAMLAKKYPELDEQLQQAATLVMAGMQQIAARFSQGGIPRSIV